MDHLSGFAQVVKQLKASYDRYFADREEVKRASTKATPANIAGFVREVMGLTVAIRNLWRGKGSISVGVGFKVQVTNPTNREFKLNRVRVEVSTQHRSTSTKKLYRKTRLLTLAVTGIEVGPHDNDKEIAVEVSGKLVRSPSPVAVVCDALCLCVVGFGVSIFPHPCFLLARACRGVHSDYGAAVVASWLTPTGSPGHPSNSSARPCGHGRRPAVSAGRRAVLGERVLSTARVLPATVGVLPWTVAWCVARCQV